MLERPRFKPHLRVEVVPGEGVFVLSGAHQTLLRGRLYEQVVPRIGDGRTADEIVDALDGLAPAAEVYYVLGQLEKKGFLRGEETVDDAESAWWWSQGIDPGLAVGRLAATPVCIRSLGIDARPLRTLLEAMKVPIAGEDEADRIVAVVDGYLHPGLAERNARALRDGRPWLLVRPVGRPIWLGPLFRPGASGCWECLANRLRANAPLATFLDARAGSTGGSGLPEEIASTPASLNLAWGLAAEAVAAWIVRGEVPHLDGKIQTLDPTSGATASHTMVRLPFCPACVAVDATAEPAVRPIALDGDAEGARRDGGYRTVPPEVTIRRHGHHVSPITGAVRMLERIGHGADEPDEAAMHVYIAGQNLARRHRSLAHLRGDLRNMSSGKGTTDAQARASGLCEGLERYSGVYRGDEPRRRATARALGDSAVPLESCLLFSERQYREREAWNARRSHYHFVPVPLDPVAEIDWTPAWSLTRREARYLPTAFCYYNAPQPEGEPFCIGDSNGCAAGNTIAEAILQGFLELVERDAVALWWYNRLRRPALDLKSFADPYIERLTDYLHSRGRTFWVLDLTTDLGIPVFAAISREPDGPTERIMPGFGAHLDPRVALTRAVTEMNQMLTNLPDPAAPPSAGQPVEDPETLHWLRTATVANQPYLVAEPQSRPLGVDDFEAPPAADLNAVVDRCRAIIEARGLEMIVLDQTRPEIGLPVVKVIVPGLRHFWARFAPGRLYDVPVRLGWLPAPTAEADLNPIPMFL